METFDRLRNARERAGFATAAEAARRFGWSIVSYRHHENGTRGFKSHTASQYARAFRVSAEWLLFGTGSDQKKTVPLVGYVGAGAEIYPIDDGGCLEDIEPMPGIGPDAVAVRVRGESMWPRYMDGDVLIYDQHTPIHRVDGQECVVSLMDGRKLVKMVRAQKQKGLATLESYNLPPIRDAKIEWVAPILWVKRG